MLMSFALGLLLASIIFYILYPQSKYKNEKTNDIVVLDKSVVHDEIRNKVINNLSRTKLVYCHSEQCWVKRNQIN